MWVFCPSVWITSLFGLNFLKLKMDFCFFWDGNMVICVNNKHTECVGGAFSGRETVSFLGSNTVVGLIYYILWNIPVIFMFLCEGECNKTFSSARSGLWGLVVNEFLSLWYHDVYSLFWYCHWLSCWHPFKHIWAVGLNIEMYFCIKSTRAMF